MICVKSKSKFSDTKRNLKISYRFIRKRKKTVFFVIFLSLVLSLLSVAIPIFTAKLLLNLSNGFLFELVKISGFIFAIELSRNIITRLMQFVYDKYMIDTVTEIQMEMFKETLKIQTSDIDKNTSGTFIDRINNDTNDIIGIFDTLISDFLDFLSNLGVLVAVIFVSFPMFIFFIVSSLTISYISHLRRKNMFEKQKKYRKIREKKTGLISEVVRGVKDIKLLNAEDGMLKITEEELNKVNKENLLLNKTSRKYNYIYGNTRDLFDFLFIVIGVFLIYSNMLTIANFVILYTYRGRIENLLTYFNRIADRLKDFNLSASRVFEILEDGFKKERNTGIDIENVRGNIDFKGVYFTYDESNVLNDITFSISQGERVGFVGASGSGKSTIFNLLTGLYEFQKGEILIDGIDIRNVSLSSLRKNLSLIPQNPYIFNFSIRDNLILSNRKVSDDEIISSCKKAEIYDRIMEFEDNFNTEVGEGGVTLSGGEKQRLAIARSLIKNTNIILFDEATSALDNITQNKIQNAIYGLDKNKTILIIAHRLSTIINCDKIVVLNDGKIIDIGTHEELLSRCKKYKELYKYEQKNSN